MSTECVSCEINLNNDIMGIGVRVALYAQIILAWGVSLTWPNTFIKNSRASFMIATALLVASLIQWKTQTLSVLDALVVSLMTSMMTIFIVVSGTTREEAKPSTSRSIETTPENANPDPAQESTPDAAQPTTAPQATRSPPSNAQQQAAAQASDPTEPIREPPRSTTQWFIRFCFVNLWGGWSFNLWKDPAHFGLEGLRANCTTNNDVTIWIFGQYVPAVSPGIQIAALVLVSILYFVALCSLFFTLEDVLEPAMRMFSSLGDLLPTSSLKRDNATTEPTVNRSLHQDPMINKIHYMLHCFAFGTLVYLLVSTEMTVRKNDKKQEMMEWSYGQVIALILLLQQFMDFCSTFIEWREGLEAKREDEEDRKKKLARAPPINANQQGDDKSVTPATPNPPS